MPLERLTTAEAPARVDTCLSQQAQLGDAAAIWELPCTS